MSPDSKRIRESMDAAGLPFPKISSDEFFFIEFERLKRVGETVEKVDKSGLAVRLVEKLGVKLGVNQVKILELIAENKFATIVAIAGKLGLSSTAVENNIAKLKEKGILRREGSDKSGHWEILE